MMHLNIQQALEHLNQQQLIIYPTDTVYGIGCRADSEEALHKLLQIKPRTTGFIILVASWNTHSNWIADPVHIPELFAEKPTTWVFKASSMVPKALCSSEHEIAMRLINHQPTKELIEKLGCPLVSTSANKPGEQTPSDPRGLTHLGIPIMDGPNGQQNPSTIIHYLTKTVIRR